MVVLETSQDRLGFDAETGALVSLHSRDAPDQEFIAWQARDPVFMIQLLDEKRRFRQLDSQQAESVAIAVSDDATTLTASYHRLAGHQLDVTVVVRVAQGDGFSHWSIRVDNQAGLAITDVQFPYVVMPYDLAGTPGTETILWPYFAGVLIKDPQPQDLRPDSPHTWQLRPENGGYTQYPGITTAQFLAYFNDRAGIYLACHDTTGRIKLIRPVHHAPGCRLGFAHVGDWPQRGARTLEYDIVLGSFTGDWYAAAELYRTWSCQQSWAQIPLHQRHDVPEWLLDSPPHIIVRIQGEIDAGPTTPNRAFLPYTKLTPLLDDLSARLDAPLLPVLMAWERPGPWVYPDCFPPVGGAESLQEFTQQARQRGWRVGTFCNGTRWVIGHYWSGYDGQDYFDAQDGDRSVCRTHTGAYWPEHWDVDWRPSYTGCVGTALTRALAQNYVRQLIDYGLDWIQFFDQNIGVCTFPCFAEDHEHPSLPGHWMTEQMTHLIDGFHALAADEVAQSQGARQVIFSVETPANEYYLPRFPICDVRVQPPGHTISPLFRGFIPLYHFLYHEFILMQGGFGTGPDPYHLAIKNAYNWVIGEIPGAVLQADGRLMNKDSAEVNWAPWQPNIGNHDDALQMLRATTALRRGPAKPFLVFGRMLAPAHVAPIPTMRWQTGGRDQQMAAIFHAAWQAPDGQLGWVLANWTDTPQSVTLRDAQLPANVQVHVATQEVASQLCTVTDQQLTLDLPPVSCLLVAT
jgi:hypothetical protein